MGEASVRVPVRRSLRSLLARIFDLRTLRLLYKGELGPSGLAITRWVEVTLTASLVISNLVGAALVYVLASWVIPIPLLDHPVEIRVVNLVALGVYGAFGVTVGVMWGKKRFPVASSWILNDADPTEEEKIAILRGPARVVAVPVVMWAGAIVVFSGIEAYFSWDLARVVASTILLGGVTTCTVAYLLSERFLRPAAARAMASGVPRSARLPGVASRTMLGWALGTALPVTGLILVAVTSLTGIHATEKQLSVTILGLGGLAVVIGLLVTAMVARATADPIRSMREALQRVEKGDLDCEVAVYDATEIGRLQAGFNQMINGLKERERIRELFGRQVGEDVARAALDGGIELGGELREVVVLFVDMIGSTRLAATREPQEVVSLINRYLEVVVRAVDEAGGWVNKFEGDAALAIFGAPLSLENACGCALGAARRIARELDRAVPDCTAAIGVASGTAVAGHIGDVRRYEYTVIGDPVNEAARLTELAKGADGHVLASSAVVSCADGDEARRWTLGESVMLRGRSEPTRLATPGT